MATIVRLVYCPACKTARSEDVPGHKSRQECEASLAKTFAGMHDYWNTAEAATEAAARKELAGQEIVADIQDLIDDCAKQGFSEGVYVRFDDLDEIAKNVQAFKDSLRLIVEGRGGIGRLAEVTGIPQPSLSRFFATVAMPHRATLLKIAPVKEV